MQRIIISFFLIITCLYAVNVFAGNQIITKKFKVDGVCGQCKERIENAAYSKGVKYASWDKETHDLTIKYDSSKTSPEVFLKNIAKAGHDNEMFKAEDADYNNIANCCKYRSGEKSH